MTQSDKQAIFKNGSTTYYYSSWFFPPDIKEQVFTVYAFVRTADDFVDCMPPNKKAFSDFVSDTWKAWAGESISNSLITDFVTLAREKKFKKSWIEAFLNAMASDLSIKEYQTTKELDAYMYGSAEVIGLMMAKILNLPKAAFKTAMTQGKAMQLLNFIRDVQEDKDLGRTYMPQSKLKKFGLKVGEWDESKWSKLLDHQLTRYRRLQAQAREGYKYIPLRYRLPIMTAAEMYLWTSRVIAKDPTIVWRQKVKPTKAQIITTFFKQLVKGAS